jgi:hypothetical protein
MHFEKLLQSSVRFRGHESDVCAQVQFNAFLHLLN